MVLPMKLPILLHATRWIHLIQKENWIYASRRRPEEPKRIDAVTVVAMHRNQPDDPLLRLVVTEEFRISIDQWEFSFPAGLLDASESILNGVIRELKEETGLDVIISPVKLSPRPVYRMNRKHMCCWKARELLRSSLASMGNSSGFICSLSRAVSNCWIGVARELPRSRPDYGLFL
jgi:NUDIX domain